MGQVLLLSKLIHHSMTNEWQGEKNIWHVAFLQKMDGYDWEDGS
jgi:hypothetical protein